MKTYPWLYIILSVLVMFLVTKEAIILPLTHDEGNTISCSTTSFWDIITYKDPVPNNHILNTLMIKFNQWVFGENLFFARLHNVLSGLLYILFSYKILERLKLDSWVKFLGFVLLVLQPFLLDFFSVTRGYGLSISFMMMSFYFFIKRLESYNTFDLIISWIFLSLGVYANFTLLNVYVPFYFLLIGHSFYKTRPQFIKEFLSITSIGLCLLGLSIVPLYKMVSTSQFVYWGNSGFLKDTWYPLVKSMRIGVNYFNISSHAFGNFLIILLVITFSIALYIAVKNKMNFTYLKYALLLVLSVLVYNNIQFYWIEVPFLNPRTALFFVPLISIAFILSVDVLVRYYYKLAIPFVNIVTSVLIFHFLSGFKVDENYEWFYDKHTYSVIKEMKHIKNTSGQTPTLNCYWIYYPSLSFHVPQIAKDDIDLAPWGQKIENDSTYQYYYTEYGELDKLKESYEIIKDFGSSYLLKRK